MPVASSSESVPAKPGMKPLAIPAASCGTSSASTTKPSRITPSIPAITISKRRYPRVCRAEQRERHYRGHQTGGQQRQPEQQVERDRGADELRQVGRHRDDLGLDPQAPWHRPREVLAASSGRLRPVAMPTLADRNWISIAIRFAPRITHSSR